MIYQGIESTISEVAERDAILLFLDRYWDVQVTEGKSLSDTVDYLLQEGAQYGIAVREDYIEDEIRWYTRFTKSAPSEFQRTTTRSERDFSTQVDPLRKLIAEQWIVSAAPKGYEQYCKEHGKDDVADRDVVLEFTGALLHQTLGANFFDLPEALTCGHVFHKVGEKGNPLHELVGVIYRQGISLGYHVVDQKYGSLNDSLFKKFSERY